MALIKNTPPEYFEKTIELLDQHFRDENYSEKAIYYDLAARCVQEVQRLSKCCDCLRNGLKCNTVVCPNHSYNSPKMKGANHEQNTQNP